MPGFSIGRHVEWGDCDAAGIVFYPNYFRWMDETFHALTRASGFDQRSLINDHGLVGTPLVNADCSFRAPARYYDDLTVSAVVQSVSRSSVSLSYSFAVAANVVAEGSETRVFVRQGPGGIEKAEIPSDLKLALERCA